MVGSSLALLQDAFRFAAHAAGDHFVRDRRHQGHHRDWFDVVLSVFIRFWQESKSNKAADKLKAMVSNTATVMRHDPVDDASDDARRSFDVQLHPKEPGKIELPIKLLVPGDVVVLSAGDMIPADCRVLTAKDLFVSQAAMTGESLPVEKFVQQKEADTTNPLELENILFMGTNVVSGAATAVVVSTGNLTYFGALAQRVTATDRAPSGSSRRRKNTKGRPSGSRRRARWTRSPRWSGIFEKSASG